MGTHPEPVRKWSRHPRYIKERDVASCDDSMETLRHWRANEKLKLIVKILNFSIFGLMQ